MIDIEKLVGKVSTDIKHGSTRAVYFPTNKRKIILDNIETEIETVLKVAKPHKKGIDTNSKLGKLQNKIEISLSKTEYNIFTKNLDGSFTTNHNGILATIIEHDVNNNWVEMLRVVNPMTIPIFNEFTGGEGFPAGLFYPDVDLSVKDYYRKLIKKENEIMADLIDEEKYKIIIQHPWIKIYLSMVVKYGIYPSDFSLRNLGYIIHPISKQKYMVICDYGYTENYHNILVPLEEAHENSA